MQLDIRDTKQQLEASKALESSTNEELAKVKEELRNMKQENQTSERVLKNEIQMHKAEIKRL